MSANSDVLIVGAGPVGLTMAIELLRHQVRVRIVEQRQSPSQHSKALAIFPRTLEMLYPLGLADSFVATGNRLRRLIAHANGEAVVSIAFDDLATPYPFTLCLPQDKTERLLEERLVALGGHVERGVVFSSLSAGHDIVHVELQRDGAAGESLAVPWVVGCDGAHSAVRHAIGASFAGAAYEEGFVLADVCATGDLPTNEGHFFLGEGGVLGFFPFGPGHGRLVGTEHLTTGRLEAPPPTIEELQTMVNQRTGMSWRLTSLEWVSRFRISRRKVDQLRHGRVFLAGDAAHIHSPAGGQGMNTGIQDAVNLAWKLALAVRGRAGDALLDSYQAEREPVASSVLRITDLITRAGLTENHAIQAIRNYLMPVFAKLARHKTADAMSELTIDYRDSPIVEHHHGPPIHAGERAPDGILHRSDSNQSLRVFDLLRDPRHVLFVFEDTTGVERERCRQLCATLAESFGDIVAPHRIASMHSPRETPDAGSGSLFVDPESKVRAMYATHRGGLVLIRPDGYVGFCSEGPHADALWAFLGRVLHIEPATTHAG